MRTVEIIGYKRANLGKAESKQLRESGNVPCVLYGGKDQIHFHVPMILFRDIVYTNEACFVDVNIEGEVKKALLQDIQFHPVSEVILHADFLEIFDQKAIKMSIPVRPVGSAPGIQKGGKLTVKNPYLNVKALPANMPEWIDVDISKLELGNSVKVRELETEEYEILNLPRVTVVLVDVPRGAKDFDALDAEEEEVLEGEEAAAAPAPAEGGEESAPESSEE